MSGYINNPFYLLGQEFLNLSLYDISVPVTLIVSIFKFFIQTKIDKKNLIIFFLTVFCDAIYDIRQGKYRHIFVNHANTPAVFRLQVLSHRIRRIIHLFDDFLHPDSRLFADLPLFIHDI